MTETEGLLFILVVLAGGCVFYLASIRRKLNEILGQLLNINENVGGMAEDSQESAESLRKVRDALMK